jgi:catechol 2,3-dioxygenase
MSHPKRVGHLVLNVRDVEVSTKFYTEVLGFHISKQSEIATFLTCGKIHHDLALFQAKEDAAPVQKGGLGLNHMAFQVEDFEALTAYHKFLEHLQVFGKPLIDRCTDHGMTCSIYLTDPDGNGIELFCNCQEDPADGLAIMSSPDRSNKELIFTA